MSTNAELIQKQKSLIAKADMQLSELTSGGGKLQEEQVKEFWQVSIASSAFLQLVKTQPMKGTEYEIPKIAMSDWTLVPGNERTSLGEDDRSKPTPGKVTLSTKTFKGSTSLSYDQLEENIEGGTLLETVRSMLAKKVASEMAIICVQGDTASGTTTKKLRALKQLDGILKQATSLVYDASGARLSKAVLETMWRKLPVEALDMANLAFLTSKNASHDYTASVANRQTPKGDSALDKMAEERYGRAPIIPVAAFPEDLGGGDKTNVVLCDPKSIVIGLGKDVTIETMQDVRSSEYIIVVRTKFDVKFVHEPFVVKATNVLASA